MKQRTMFLSAFAASAVATFVVAGYAQQSAPSAFVPIVLDAAKFDQFYAELREISMPARAFQQITTLLQGLERQAQAEKAAADESSKSK